MSVALLKLKMLCSVQLSVILSGFSTETIGAAHSATSTGSKVPSDTKRFNSFSTLSRKKYGTEHSLQYLGVAEGSTMIFALKPVRVPRPS